jgi:hypothetical protein
MKAREQSAPGKPAKIEPEEAVRGAARCERVFEAGG